MIELLKVIGEIFIRSMLTRLTMKWYSRLNARERFNKRICKEICSNPSNESSDEKICFLYLFIRYFWKEEDGQCSYDISNKLTHWLKTKKIDLNTENWYFSSRLDVRIKTKMNSTTSMTEDKKFLQRIENMNEEIVFAKIIYELRKFLPILMKSNNDVNYTNTKGQTILHILFQEYSKMTDNLSKDQIKRMQQLLENLLKQETPLYINDMFGNTPLHIITSFRNKKILQIITSCLVNLNLYNKFGNTALHIIVDNCVDVENGKNHDDFIDIVCSLISKGANPNTKNFEGITPVHLAAEKFQIEILKFFMDNGCNFENLTNEDETPIHFACKSSLRLADTTKLIETISFLKNKNFNAVSKKGYMHLHYSAESGNIEVVEQLIKLGADVNCRTQELQLTPLHLALKRDRLDIAKALINAGADINAEAEDGSLPVFLAAMLGSVESLRYFIDLNVDLTRREKYSGLTILHFTAYDETCWSKSEKALKKFDLIIEKNLLDVNDPGNCKITPLILATYAQNLEIVEALIAKGADVNFQAEKSELTALHIASLAKNARLVDILITAGANVNQRGSIEQMPALHFALIDNFKWNMGVYPKWVTSAMKEKSFIDKLWSRKKLCSNGNPNAVVSILMNKRAYFNTKDSKGRTALHLATLRSDNVELIERLLFSLAHVNIQDKEGKLPLHNALTNKSKWANQVIWLLMDVGANINDPDTVRLVLKCNNLTKKLVTEHAMKLKLIGFPICHVYTSLSLVLPVQDFLSECTEEANRFIDYKDNDDKFSFYKFLHTDVTHQRHIFYQTKIGNSLKNLGNIFPIYSRLIRAASLEAVKRKFLLVSARTSWHKLTNVYLPSVCLERILSYLSNRYLEVLAANEHQLEELVNTDNKQNVFECYIGDK